MESVDSLVKWDNVTYKNSQDKRRWHFLQAMNETYCSLNTHHEYLSFGCHPCTRLILLWQPGRKGLRLREDLMKDYYGIHEGHIKLQVIPILPCHNYGAAFTTIIHKSLVIYSLLLLHASWFFFCQAIAILYYDKLAAKLVGGGVVVGKLRIDENKVLLTGQSLGASLCTRQLIPGYDSFRPPNECHSEENKRGQYFIVGLS